MKAKILNFVLFQAAWFCCVLSAARGLWWVPPIGAMCICAVHMWMIEQRLPASLLLGIVTLLGTAIDVVLWKAGIVSFAHADATVLSGAVWFASLWAAFATTLQLSLAWMQSRPLVAIAFGAIGGPLAYLAGERLGAIVLPSKLQSLIVLSIEWAILTPLLMWITVRLTRKEPTA